MLGLKKKFFFYKNYTFYASVFYHFVYGLCLGVFKNKI